MTRRVQFGPEICATVTRTGALGSGTYAETLLLRRDQCMFGEDSQCWWLDEAVRDLSQLQREGREKRIKRSQ